MCFIFTDELFDLMGANQMNLAENIAGLIVPVLSKHLDIPLVLDADSVIFTLQAHQARLLESLCLLQCL